MAFEFMKRLSCVLCACAALGPFFVSAADGKKPVFLNVDDTHFYQSRGRLGIDIGEREIREMVAKYRGTNVRIVPGLEILLCERRDVRYYITPEQLLGIVAVNYANGADGAYVYNLFDDPCWQDEAKRWWRIGDQPNETLAVFWPNQLKWLALIGSPEKVMAAPRDHVLTFRDLQPEWRPPSSSSSPRSRSICRTWTSS